MSVEVSVLLFAMARDRVGAHEMRITLNELWANRDALMRHICCQVLSCLSELLPILMLAINEVYVVDDNNQIQLRNNDVLALIPPITGG